jgi:lipoprotein-anchoring transpeptidase ErfK/SrfK
VALRKRLVKSGPSLVATGAALAVLSIGPLAPSNSWAQSKPVVLPEAKPETVPFELNYKPGSIVIINAERKLYYVQGDGTALRYGVAIGNADEVWTGKQVVTEKKENPRWVSPDGDDEVEPGPDNPLGVRAMYLGWTLWRIHGTPSRNSIGQAVSNGCIRMRNEDVTHLYERVHIGAPVYAIGPRNSRTMKIDHHSP